MSHLASVSVHADLLLMAKLRDLAALVNQAGGLSKQNQEANGSELEWAKDSIQYGPPYKNRPTDRAPKEIVSDNADMAVSPTITGLTTRDQRRSQRAGTSGAVGSNQAFSGTWGHGVGAHIT